MNRLTKRTATVLAGLAAACSEPTIGGASALDTSKEPRMADDAVGGERPARQLPYAQGRSFEALDEYLAHLRRNSAIDLPWYREIRPGVYERVTTRVPRGEPQVFTREQLMRRFGFTR